MSDATPYAWLHDRWEWLSDPAAIEREGVKLERGVRVRPGYDCRAGCTHTPRRDHGCHGDEWYLAIRASDYAVELCLYTNIVAKQRLTDDWRDDRTVYPAFCWRHSSFKTESDQVRLGVEPDDCPLLGKCFNDGEGLGLFSESLWTAEDTRSMLPVAFGPHELIVAKLLEAGPWWERLVAAFLSFRRDAVASHDALPQQCSACGGKGVVESAAESSLLKTADEVVAKEYYAAGGPQLVLRVIAGLEVALLEPERARQIMTELHDECVRAYSGAL